MIFNPVVSGGGGSETYTITNNTAYQFPSTGQAGQVVSAPLLGSTPTIRLADNPAIIIPSATGEIETRADRYFVMPAGDITIS